MSLSVFAVLDQLQNRTEEESCWAAVGADDSLHNRVKDPEQYDSPRARAAYRLGYALMERLKKQPVPPFPPEPAPGSPESVKQAAETIQRWTKPEALRAHRMVKHFLGEWIHWKDHVAALETVEKQRDEVADALAAVRDDLASMGMLQTSTRAAMHAALRKAGR